MPAILTLTTADGQLVSEVTIPTSMAEVTLAQWIAFVTPGGPEADVVMTGLTPEVLGALGDNDRAQILEHLMFLTDASMLRQLLPTADLYEVGNCAYGLQRQAQEYFLTHPDLTRLAQGAYLYALYRAPITTTMPANALAAAHAAVLAAPVLEMYADCQHFLASWERVQAGTTLAGPKQLGLLTIARDEHGAPIQPQPAATSAKPKPTGWLGKLGLGNLWNPAKRAVA